MHFYFQIALCVGILNTVSRLSVFLSVCSCYCSICLLSEMANKDEYITSNDV